MERGKVLEYLTIFGAAAILGFLAYITAVGLYVVDNYGKTVGKAAFGTGEYEVIKVYARQFSWVFEYPNGTKVFNELVIERGKLYKLEITSLDVVHSFYIRELGIKYDAVPGFWYTMWLQVDKPGVYNIFCAEYCGAKHYLMLAKLIVVG